MKLTSEIIDNIPNSVCQHVIFHSKDFDWQFLALKINLTRLNLKINLMKGSENTINECCGELKTLLKRSLTIPNAQHDVRCILDLQQ
jgi:hypothetical protein